MTSRDFWYGMSFHMAKATEQLLAIAKESETPDQKDYYTFRAAILVDLNGAIRAGLDRELERENARKGIMTDTAIKCDICGTNKDIIGTASSPVGPSSHCTCKQCLLRGALPESNLEYLYTEVGPANVKPFVKYLLTYKDGKYMTWGEWVHLRIKEEAEFVPDIPGSQWPAEDEDSD